MIQTRARRGVAVVAFLAVLLIGCPDALAQDSAEREEKGTVTYVTSTMVYGDLGRRNGLKEGDTVHVRNAKGEVATLRVLHLASKSFSAEVIEKSGTVLEGDAVFATVRGIVIPERPVLAADSIPAPVVLRQETAAPISSAPSSRPETDETRFRGRVAMQYYALRSGAAGGLTFSQPAAVLRFTADRLLSMPLEFSYYSNHRYDARSEDARAGTSRDRLRNRFYQLSLRYGSDGDPYSAVLGRFIPYQVGGIGTVDGVMLTARRGRFEGGVLAGAQPGYRDAELSLKDQKLAVYGGYVTDAQDWQLRSNAAVAQTYVDGAVDRSYIYLVNSLSLSNALILYQNATFDLYDVDKGSGNGRPHLTDMYLSATWRPQRWLSVTGAFADRRSVYFLRSFASIPDSLFRDSRLRTFQLSAGVNIPGGMYASLSVSLRTQENSDTPAAAYSARYTWSNLLGSRANLYLLGSYSDNIYNTSRSIGVEANRDLFDALYAALRVQQYRYVYSIANRSLDRFTVATDLDYRIGQLWYLSLNYERYWEGGVASDRLYSEISLRFR